VTDTTPCATVSDAAPLYLRRREDRRLRAGHLWVYSNEVDTARSPLTALAPGDPVDIIGADGRWLGSGYANPATLIAARIVSRDRQHRLGRPLLVHRLKVAAGLRERIYGAPFYRLAFGEADGLPGLVVDRFGDVLVAQVTTAGMERMRAEILDALERTFRPRAVVWNNDSSMRELEGLPRYREPAIGDMPETVEVRENADLICRVPLPGGQKTGWYYDQRDNRSRFATLVRDSRVLDLYCYAGAWGLQAALAGASEVWCVDSSASMAEHIRANAEALGVADRVRVITADAMDTLRELRAARELFDAVVVDPPAFVKRKKDLQAGTGGYLRLNQAALQVVRNDGWLVSCSCSYHLDRDGLRDIVRQAGYHIDRTLQIVAEGQQAMDHPVHPAMPETRYLKALFTRVLPRM